MIEAFKPKFIKIKDGKFNIGNEFLDRVWFSIVNIKDDYYNVFNELDVVFKRIETIIETETNWHFSSSYTKFDPIGAHFYFKVGLDRT